MNPSSDQLSAGQGFSDGPFGAAANRKAIDLETSPRSQDCSRLHVEEPTN